ncbi:MAG: molecular chaperone HtpG [Verrucomicrobiales bacterium]|nr:molecular chaperone HtpG [Verrucomicrobiales bacterium]
METTSAHHQFQAEVRQLLDIVINSLYTDREIFVRELVSNASDAIEKLRHLQLTRKEPVFEPERPLEITITTDETAGTITLADSGIGMTREELVQNLGTIAHSGSKAFLQNLADGSAVAGNVIGKFGVGFYSVFMAAKRVRVYTHSWREDGEHLCWSSDGIGGFEIEEAPDQQRGCRIVVELKEDQAEFAKAGRIKGILERYSNFVSFPILLNGERVNTVEALWLKSKGDITEEQYQSFYQFIGHSFDDPRYRLHFSADAPLAINALVFVPGENQERWGMGQMEPGVALYCRRVLIDSHPEGLLPEWLRFLKGVIDSDDLPLNISRETMQDSALVRKLNEVITKRFLKFLEENAAEDSAKYTEFFRMFSRFLKEGIATDPRHRESLGRLLRFESSFTEKGALTSFDEYLGRMRDGQTEIYYQIAPSREAIESGPYLEGFKARGLEVVYFEEAIDEYVCEALREHGGKRLVPADRADVKLDEIPATDGQPEVAAEEMHSLCDWLSEVSGGSTKEVRSSKRLVESPAAALTPENHPSAQMRAMMRAMQQEVPAPSVILELNPRHELIRKLAAARSTAPDTARLVARQLLDNALISAGLMEDPREMVRRVQDLMLAALP